MLRDVGFEAFAYDPFAPNLLAAGYDGDIDQKYDMLVAIETLEHLADPAGELDSLFKPGHDLIVVRTQPYRGEGTDWHYFFGELGQHVFFYSYRARELIANKYGYEVVSCGDMSVFSRRPISRLQRLLLDRPSFPLAALRSLLPFASRGGIARDDRALKAMRKAATTGPLPDALRDAERASRDAGNTPAT
jgi:hypothetical protein